MSDKQKVYSTDLHLVLASYNADEHIVKGSHSCNVQGLISAVEQLFPQSEHRFCVRHMWQNFQQHFKGDILKNQLWKIARSNTVQLYEKGMEEMELLNADAHKWLHELEPNIWVKAFQSDLPKCDILLNNICEVFNRLA